MASAYVAYLDTCVHDSVYLEAMSLAEALPGVNDAIDQLNAMNAAIKRRLNVRKTSQANEGEAEANVIIVELEDESNLGQIS